VQVKLTADLMGRTGLEELAEIIKDAGGGTAHINKPIVSSSPTKRK
jgi:hypothetical protein